jgi:hypothetical protein
MATPEEGGKVVNDDISDCVCMGSSPVVVPTRSRRDVQKESDQDIKQMCVTAIKETLTSLKVDYNGCIERHEIEKLLRDARREQQLANDEPVLVSDTPGEEHRPSGLISGKRPVAPWHSASCYEPPHKRPRAEQPTFSTDTTAVGEPTFVPYAGSTDEIQ